MPASMRSTLIFSHGFHESTVDGFLKDYKKSVEFAGLMSASEDNKRDPERVEAPKVALGDFVQWEHDGILGLPSALKLVKLSEDGSYGWVEGHTTGLPVSELVRVDPPASPPVPPLPQGQPPSPPAPQQRPKHAEHRTLPPKGVGMRQEVFSLTEGDVTIQWPETLSQESLEDFNDWLRILERKVKRSVVTAPPTKLEGDPSDSPLA